MSEGWKWRGGKQLSRFSYPCACIICWLSKNDFIPPLFETAACNAFFQLSVLGAL